MCVFIYMIFSYNIYIYYRLTATQELGCHQLSFPVVLPTDSQLPRDLNGNPECIEHYFEFCWYDIPLFCFFLIIFQLSFHKSKSALGRHCLRQFHWSRWHNNGDLGAKMGVSNWAARGKKLEASGLLVLWHSWMKSTIFWSIYIFSLIWGNDILSILVL